MHLLELARGLEAAAAASSGGWSGRCEECELLARASDERDPDAIFAAAPPRIRARRAGRRRCPRARALARETAERQNRPVQSVLGDATLVELARRGPDSREALGQIRGVGGGASGSRGEELLEVVRRGAQRPADTAPRHLARPHPDPTTRRWWPSPSRCSRPGARGRDRL